MENFIKKLFRKDEELQKELKEIRNICSSYNEIYKQVEENYIKMKAIIEK